MKVKELVEKLKQCDPEALVVCRGYEGGVAECTKACEVEIYLNVNTAWYYGEHELAGFLRDEELSRDFIKVKAILL